MMSRIERMLLQKKQEKLQVGRGVPVITDLKEGVPVLRETNEDGLVEYVRHKGVLYKNVYTKV